MGIKSQVIKALGGLLSNGDEADRCYASRALGALADSQATPWLIDRLRDDDIDVCIDAAEALGSIGDRSAVSALLESLQHDPDGEIKTSIVSALGQLGGDDVIPHLISIAEKRPDNMAFDDTSDWDPWWDMQLHAVISLGELRAAEAIPVLIKILDDQELQDIESEVLSALAQIGGDANDFLLERLREGTPRQRRRVARALRKSPDRGTITPLGRSLGEANADVREAAIASLAARNASRYLPAILLLFRDASPQVRDAAIRAATDLSANCPESDLQAGDFTHLLEDPDSRVKKTVLETLQNLPGALDDSSQTRVVATLEDNDPDVVSAACQLLLRKGVAVAQQQILATLTDSEKPAETRCRILESLDKSSAWNAAIETALIREITSGERIVRLAALNTLAALDHSFPQGEAALENIAANGEPATLWPIDIITAAVNGKLIRPQPLDKVIPIIPADQVETAAPDTQQEEQPEPAPLSTLDAIIQAAQKAATEVVSSDETESVDDEETIAFKQLLEENKARTRRMFSSDSANVEVAVDVRRQAARILGKTNSAAALQALACALDDDDLILQLEAAESLGRMNHQHGDFPALEKIRDSLRSRLESPDQGLRMAAVRSLGTIGHPDDLNTLLNLLEDKELFMRLEAVRALTEMLSGERSEADIRTIYRHFIALLKDQESGVRRAAILGLPALLGKLDPEDNDGSRQQAVEGAIDAGFMGADGQASDMARGLKAIDPELGTEKLLARLAELPSSVERRFAIEMLTEIHRPEVGHTVKAA